MFAHYVELFNNVNKLGLSYSSRCYIDRCAFTDADYHIRIRFIPQGMVVNNNVGPYSFSCSECPNIHPNYCRQLTLCLHDICLEVRTVHGNALRLFWAMHPLLIPILINIVILFTIFSKAQLFSY